MFIKSTSRCMTVFFSPLGVSNGISTSIVQVRVWVGANGPRHCDDTLPEGV